MLAALRLMRAPNLAVSFLGTLVAGLVAAGRGVSIAPGSWLLLGLAAASTLLVTAAGNVLNDLGDQEGDRVNHPERPLVTGEISPPGARRLTVGLFVGAGAVAVPVALQEPLVAVLLAVAILTVVGYEFWWKAKGFVGNLSVALLTGLVFLYGGAALGAPALLAPFAGMAFLATLSREIIKDMEDARGDVGRSTLPRERGFPYATRVARAAVGAAIVLSALPLLWFVRLGSVEGLAYAGLVAVADATFVVSVVYLPERLRFEQTVSKAAMTAALFAFLAVAFR
ncbi:MAG: geranylgeranylglycerol-phosphate geranylgeranyltransferase [Thermoplasmata archaeon]|nr:geranylgeranylglycerol-phosphate geranylgeranyltransferase [Thermoplasmata archaeon]